MKVLCALLFVCTVFVDVAVGVSVVVNNDEVYVDDKPVDLSQLQVIKDSPYYTTYELRSGQSVIMITKSKVGNAIAVESKGPMTEEDKKKMEEMQQKISEDVEKNIKQVQENINQFHLELNDRINNMNRQITDMFKMNMQFPFFF